MRGRANALECYGYCVQMLGWSCAGRWGACDLARYCVLCVRQAHSADRAIVMSLVSPPYIRHSAHAAHTHTGHGSLG